MTIRFPAGHQGKPGNVFHVVARLGTPDRGEVATNDKGETMYIGIGTLILIILLLILIF